jgi:serine/threonine-protein phosphatase 5|tara:strand:+ start:56801 stop:58153 length:1353 start_codon:yes stop_codon:yes gene_type:complete
VAYSNALEVTPGNAILLSNRAFAHLKLENYGSAIEDATTSIENDPSYIKAYYRRASSQYALGHLSDALKDFKTVCKMHPQDRDGRLKLKECENALRKQRFEAAIATPEEEVVKISSTIDVKAMILDSAYDGVRLEESHIITDAFVDDMIERFKAQKTIASKYAFEILMQSKQIFEALPSVVDIPIPDGKKFTVCGDVHGQFFDLCNIFELNGKPSAKNQYLFNGDFVDRGSFSVEVILTLLAFKCLNPSSIYLTRGNHETAAMNKMYGFDGEVKAKYNVKLADLFQELFQYLPLGAVLEKKVFIVHGGLFSRDGVTLDELRKIDRFKEPPESGPFCEMLWSDPGALPGRHPSKRGVGVAFGADVTKKFLQDNDLQLVVRSHEVKDEGFEVDHDGNLITVFSAPNYCDQMGNKGAFITFHNDCVPHFTSFEAVPHPPSRPMQYASNSFMFQ